MRKLYILAVMASLFAAVFSVQNANASSPNIVISQVQLGNAASAKNEFVQIYNNSSINVEITNWCLSYLSSSLTPREMACFTPENDSTHIFLPSHSFAIAVSNEMIAAVPPIKGDLFFSYTLSGTTGYVRILDNLGTEIDKVGWGVSTPEINLVAAAPVGKVLSRKTISEDTLQDTNVNSDDFEIILGQKIYTYGSIYDMVDLCKNIDGIQSILPVGFSDDGKGSCSPPLFDFCPNIEDIQITIPIGYALDDKDDCMVDVCLNIDGLQQAIPGKMDLDISGNCVTHDECFNLPDIQTTIPVGYMRGDDNECLLDLLPLKITELLPNVTGSDIGKEFIEIYNPNDSDVDLGDYVFYVGVDDAEFSFPAGTVIKPGEYLAFYNSVIKFTLLNSTSFVRLESIDGTIIDESPGYLNPKEDMAWAQIDGIWQYSNQPTPGSLNLSNLIVPDPIPDLDPIEILASGDLKPCAANQYRSPDTNRCRLLPTADSVLTPCKDGQYRSEETNRCRSIAAAVLGTSDLKPCDVGQERNPDTNRCRNIVSSIPQADYAPEQANEPSNNDVLWWSLAGVGLLAISYGVWEWRKEIGQFAKKTASFFRHKK